MDNKRFDIFFERHIGIGVRWDKAGYSLDLSIAFPFFTITIGLGKKNKSYGNYLGTN